MIIKMKKATILCLNTDKDLTLEKLRELGIIHVQTLKNPGSNEYTDCENQLSKSERAIGILETQKPIENSSNRFVDISGEDICELTLEAFNDKTNLKKHLETLTRDKERLSPWGNFSPELINEFRQKGIHIYLCAGIQQVFEDAAKHGICKIISQDKKKINFAIISNHELDTNELPIANVPQNTNLTKIESEIKACRNSLKIAEEKLDDLCHGHQQLFDYQQNTAETLEFLGNRDNMEDVNQVTYLQGFVPVDTVDELKKTALKNGWALQIVDPNSEDRVPTLIRVPKIFDIAKPIFSFIGIAPGYHEWDVSACFLFFFTIFFGMIVGDAGYGLIFLALAITGKIMLKDEKFRLPLNLFIVLSTSTIIWGALTCTYFGLPYDIFPTWMRGYEKLAKPEIKDQYVQYLCFLLAAIHLSLARSWKALLMINSFKSLGQIGWGLLIWGNFFTAVKLIVFTKAPFPQFVLYMYIIGFILIILFSINWKDVGNILNFPFTLIGSFVDVLSYIRLFAVGLSTFYIAQSFNDMGIMVLDIHISKILFPLLILGMILIIILGHALNIFLALVAVLVHGIRLNTLEFSNHMELTWSGTVYKPFKKLINSQNKES